MFFEKYDSVLLESLEHFMSIPYEHLPNVIGYQVKERIVEIRGMILHIWPNDHMPPHFHVVSKDGKIDARFTIEDCKPLINNIITTRQTKHIEAFHNREKSLLKEVWDKRYKVT